MLKKQNKSNGGFTLIEVLIAISLVAFSLIAILSSFIYQGKMNNSVNNRNIAVLLAEEKMEEYFKHSYDNMPSNKTDYITYNLNREPMSTDEDGAKNGNAFQRIATTVQGLHTTSIKVQVYYNYNGKGYDFNIILETIKGG